jgi:hypothetical protein
LQTAGGDFFPVMLLCTDETLLPGTYGSPRLTSLGI